ncbi:uncharacterized protein TNCV_1646061 [Trichonephila clavipes]|nr:uncharacterized protein TNCV_1646061 [Trichonephila clavipes]
MYFQLVVRGIPPPVQNGRVKQFTSTHGSSVKYECNKFYFLARDSTVQCLFGEWKGMSPICKDSRCHPKSLSHKTGVSLSLSNLTLSGESLNVHCTEGFVPSGIKPLCSRGLWTEFGASPCKELNCTVEEVPNGTLKEIAERKAWMWRRFQRVMQETFVKVILFWCPRQKLSAAGHGRGQGEEVKGGGSKRKQSFANADFFSSFH